MYVPFWHWGRAGVLTGMSSLPPINWRYCGHQMKLWRTLAEVSREELAEESSYGCETIKSMEQGRRRPTLRVLEVADRLCGAHGLLVAAHDYLGPEPVVSRYDDFFRYEAEAIAYSSYEPLLIPGLLQTEETMRALFNGAWPPPDDEAIEGLVKARLGRQSLLKEQGRAFVFLIAEAPLRHPLAGPEAHKCQLGHLLDVGQQRNVAIQVLPAGSVVVSASFVLLELPSLQWIVYEEAHWTGLLYEESEKVSHFTRQHAAIGRMALPPAESERFIRKLVEGL